ncbi:beta-ketoacyl-[acyl-carrier-protein] synthase II [archaeon]|nr:MAG: beta-ketoacyl-[acyl-carrier-protein] synthase II [archaeon]
MHIEKMILLVCLVVVFLSTSFGWQSSALKSGLLTRSARRFAAVHMSYDPKTIVVTGLGIISPSGNTVTHFFDNICNGVSSIGPLDRFDARPYKCKIAAQVKDFDPKSYYQSKKKIGQNDLSCHYAVAASHLALADAGITMTATDATRVGVCIGSAFGGMATFEQATLELHRSGVNAVNPYTIPMILGNTAAGVVAMETGAKGPNFGVQTACATATHAFGEALRLMRNGDADVMLAGGCEAPLTPLSFAGFCNLMAMNTQHNDSPDKASRPFDLHRGGFVMSEGAGVLVLETLQHAVQRGAKVYCELAGYGASCDAYHITSPDPEGQGLKRAVMACLKDGNIQTHEVSKIPTYIHIWMRD